MSSAAVQARAEQRPRLTRAASGEPRVLFLCSGALGWPGQGCGLYRSEPVFRESVEDCAAVLGQIGFKGVVESFESPEFAATKFPARIRQCVLHIALIDLWESLDIVPDGVLGVSVGELSAIYAAGAISRQEAVSAFCKLVLAIREREPTIVWDIDAGTERARELCALAPATLHHLGTYGPGLAMVACSAEDEVVIGPFLKEQVGIKGRLASGHLTHTPRPATHRATLSSLLAEVTTGPLRCPVYSSAAGGPLPDQPDLGADHWVHVRNQPFYFDEALSAALRHGFTVLLTIGGYPTDVGRQIEALARGLKVRAEVLESIPRRQPPRRLFGLRPPKNELSVWHGSVDRLRAHGASKQRAQSVSAFDPSTITLDELDLADPDLRRNPFAYFEILRRAGPLHWLPRHDAWLVLDLAGARQVLRADAQFRPAPFSDTDADRLRRERPAIVRRLAQDAISGSRVSELASDAKTTAEELLGRDRGGRDLDVVEDYARPLADHVAARLLGIDPAQARALTGHAFLGQRAPTLDRFHAASTALGALADLPLVSGLRNGGSVSPDEAESVVREFWIAAAMTTRLVLPSAVLLLLQQPELQTRLKAEPELLGQFVEEALRLHPAGYTIPRIAVSETIIADRGIRPGETVLVCIAAANRDPAQFEKPHDVRLDRSPIHLTFGDGQHRCAGARIARATLISGLATLLSVEGHLHAGQPLSTVRWLDAGQLHGLERLWVAWE